MPNPAEDFLWINSNFPVDQISIYTISGELVLQINIPELPLNINNLKTGIYLVKVIAGQQKNNLKLVVK